MTTPPLAPAKPGLDLMLVRIKLLHTAVWFVVAGCIVAIPIAGARSQYLWAAAMTGVVLIECIVLAANRGACPLTGLAARYTEERAANFDILPAPLAGAPQQAHLRHAVRRRRAVRLGAMADQVMANHPCCAKRDRVSFGSAVTLQDAIRRTVEPHPRRRDADRPSRRVVSVGAPLQMHGLVYRGPGRRAWEERPRPVLREPTDAIVRVTTSTICGTDLHILKGDVPSVTEGRILGHEGVGVVTDVGAGVTTFRAGDRVLISCITSCGRCDFCRKQMYSHCRHGGWILGNTIDGTQADYVRIPYADTSLYAIPADGDEEALVMLSDILPTGFECGVLNGQVHPGDIVAIVGAGPVGLAALLTAQFYSPASIVMIDLDDKRLDVARTFGATALINSTDGGAVQRVMDLTAGHGVDVAIEAVGRAGHLRHLSGDSGAGWAPRECRRAWRAR